MIIREWSQPRVNMGKEWRNRVFVSSTIFHPILFYSFGLYMFGGGSTVP